MRLPRLNTKGGVILCGGKQVKVYYNIIKSNKPTDLMLGQSQTDRRKVEYYLKEHYQRLYPKLKFEIVETDQETASWLPDELKK